MTLETPDRYNSYTALELRGLDMHFLPVFLQSHTMEVVSEWLDVGVCTVSYYTYTCCVAVPNIDFGTHWN